MARGATSDHRAPIGLPLVGSLGFWCTLGTSQDRPGSRLCSLGYLSNTDPQLPNANARMSRKSKQQQQQQSLRVMGTFRFGAIGVYKRKEIPPPILGGKLFETIQWASPNPATVRFGLSVIKNRINTSKERNQKSSSLLVFFSSSLLLFFSSFLLLFSSSPLLFSSLLFSSLLFSSLLFS